MHIPRWPSDEEVCYILKMLESRLIDYRFTEPWADALIATVEAPPAWICDLASRTHQDDLVNTVQGYLISNTDLNTGFQKYHNFHVGCQFLRYKRGEWSWAQFLKEAGQVTDSSCSSWNCEQFYSHLNILEESGYTKDVEVCQVAKLIKDPIFAEVVAIAEEQYWPFRIARYGA
ncbi:MAG: hypothetical protein AMXMBFR7_04090 [Planctomycetota bacterium]